jgi:hypothetical protein
VSCSSSETHTDLSVFHPHLVARTFRSALATFSPVATSKVVVPGAAHLRAVEEPLAERPPAVRAAPGEGVERAVHVEEGHHLAADGDLRGLSRREAGDGDGGANWDMLVS